MSFKSRAQGTTLRRGLAPRAENMLRRGAENAVVDPHSARERFDADFILTFQCSRCLKYGTSARKDIQQATRWHAESECERRDVAQDEPINFRVFYPKQ